ncbi:MAG: hypothetical protein U5M23_09550 [Marinagarivorans sp.]|nr:hypothetical protein [Marinagarivorans sp.]
MKFAKVFLVVLMGLGFVGCEGDDSAKVNSVNKFEGFWRAELYFATDEGQPTPASSVVVRISAAGDVYAYICKDEGQYVEVQTILLLMNDTLSSNELDIDVQLSLVNEQLLMTDLADSRNTLTLSRVSQLPTSCSSQNGTIEVGFFRGVDENGVTVQ